MALEGELANGADALEAIHELRPEVVFLDVQMPLMNDFDVARAIDPARMPLIVFVTAFDQYALDAFRVSAVQYLVKPLDRDEFRGARAFARRAHRDRFARPHPPPRALDHRQQRRFGDRRLFRPADRQDVFLSVERGLDGHVAGVVEKDRRHRQQQRGEDEAVDRRHRNALAQHALRGAISACVTAKLCTRASSSSSVR